jgi:hypothetical protein
MVSGVVVPPRLDLANEELLKSHIHSVWLSVVGLDLKDSIESLLDLNSDDYPLNPNVAEQIKLSDAKIQECLKACREIVQQCKDDLDGRMVFRAMAPSSPKLIGSGI